MASLVFSPEADDKLDRLEADPARRRLAAHLNGALDMLEADPGHVRNRRRRLTLGVWGIAVVVDDDE